jgi:hypothetical protein
MRTASQRLYDHIGFQFAYLLATMHVTSRPESVKI